MLFLHVSIVMLGIRLRRTSWGFMSTTWSLTPSSKFIAFICLSDRPPLQRTDQQGKPGNIFLSHQQLEDRLPAEKTGSASLDPGPPHVEMEGRGAHFRGHLGGVVGRARSFGLQLLEAAALGDHASAAWPDGPVLHFMGLGEREGMG